MAGIATDSLTLGGRIFRAGESCVVVLGAGVMGPGIAQVFAEHGFDVDLCDPSAEALERAWATLNENLDLKIRLGLTDRAAADQALARVRMHSDSQAALQRSDLVVEAVPENADVKRAVYEATAQAAPHAVVWSNTSTMNVFELAPPTLKHRMVVAHWFAPAHILPLVEVVGDEHTPSEILAETDAVLRMLGKAPVRLEKFVPGFIINRLLRALGREAFHLLESGVISVENLDAAVRTSLAPRMQVLGLMQRYDYTGLGLSMRNLSDPRFEDAPVNRCPEALKQRVDKGELGVTTGKGFYDYAGRDVLALQHARDVRLWQVVDALGELVTDPRPI